MRGIDENHIIESVRHFPGALESLLVAAEEAESPVANPVGVPPFLRVHQLTGEQNREVQGAIATTPSLEAGTATALVAARSKPRAGG